MKIGRGALWALPFLLGCGKHEPPARVVTSSLPAGFTARVGAELVRSDTVGRVAERQGVTPRVALELAITDATLAQGARAVLAPGTIHSIERAGLARAVLEQMSQQAAASGAPSEDELAAVVQERWVDLDRPEAVRTTHAVVMNDQPARDADARAVAEKLAQRLRGASSSEELMQLAKDFPAGDFKIRAERLPFVTPDGRTFQRREQALVAQNGGFDLNFARAANAIEGEGSLSPVVKSSFGYHVIRLDERLPGHVVPKADLPSLLQPDVLTRRSSKARRALLDGLHGRTTVQVDRAFDELTAQIKVAP